MAAKKRPCLKWNQKVARRRVGRSYIWLLIAQVAMASGAIFGRLALEHMGALSVVAWRLTLATIPLGIRYLLVRPARPVWRQEIWLGVAGVMLGVQFATWIESLLRLSVGISTLLTCTTPLWTALYEAFVLHHPLRRSFWAALVVAILGMGLMVLDGGGQPPLPGQVALGAVLALLSSLCMSCYFVIIQRISTLAEQEKTYHTVDIITRTYAYSAVLLLGLSLFDSQPVPALSDWRAWSGVVGMALITQGVGHSLQNACLRRIGSTMVGFVSLLEPLLSALLAMVLFHEHLTLKAVGGGVLVLLALAWAVRVMPSSEMTAAASKPVTAKRRVA